MGHPNVWLLLTEIGQEEVSKVAEAGELSQSWAGATEKLSSNSQPQSIFFGEAEAQVSLAWRATLSPPNSWGRSGFTRRGWSMTEALLLERGESLGP